MAITVECDHCNQTLGIAQRKPGTRIACPICGGQITIPERKTAPAAAARPEAVTSSPPRNPSESRPSPAESAARSPNAVPGSAALSKPEKKPATTNPRKPPPPAPVRSTPRATPTSTDSAPDATVEPLPELVSRRPQRAPIAPSSGHRRLLERYSLPLMILGILSGLGTVAAAVYQAYQEISLGVITAQGYFGYGLFICWGTFVALASWVSRSLIGLVLEMAAAVDHRATSDK